MYMASSQQTRILSKINHLKKRKQLLKKQLAEAPSDDHFKQTSIDISEIEYAIREWIRFGKSIGVNPKRLK